MNDKSMDLIDRVGYVWRSLVLISCVALIALAVLYDTRRSPHPAQGPQIPAFAHWYTMEIHNRGNAPSKLGFTSGESFSIQPGATASFDYLTEGDPLKEIKWVRDADLDVLIYRKDEAPTGAFFRQRAESAQPSTCGGNSTTPCEYVPEPK